MENEVLAHFVDPARMRVEIATGSGHSIELDGGAPDGDDSGARPMETLLAALAGCTSMDVASILRKKRQVPTDYAIAVRGEHGEAHPRVFTRIVVEHRVSGAVDPEAIRRSVELSAARYCPVSAMLSSAATIEHWYRLGDQAAVLVVTTGPGAAAG
jgi:putative redox protein